MQSRSHWPRFAGLVVSFALSLDACAQSGGSAPGSSGDGGSGDDGAASSGGDSATPSPDAAGPAADGAAETSTTRPSDGAADAGSSPDGDASSSQADAGATAWQCPPGPFPSNPAMVTATRIDGVPPPDVDGGINGMGFSFSTIEGPVWVGDTLYVSEFGNQMPPPSRILGITLDGGVQVVGPAGWNPGTNGLAVDGAGVLYGAVHADGSISRLDVAGGTRTPIASEYPADSGVRFDAPNDLAVRSDGIIYFSDSSGFQSPQPPPQMQERVYRVAPGTHAVSVVEPQAGAQPLTHPNGVTLSLDESLLYVSANEGLFAFPVMPDGSTGPRPAMPFSTENVDGMVIDCAGNLYGAVINTQTVQVWSPSGALIGQIMAPGAGSVTNVAFGGPDHKTLFITAQGTGGGRNPPNGGAQGVYQVALSIPGKPY